MVFSARRVLRGEYFNLHYGVPTAQQNTDDKQTVVDSKHYPLDCSGDSARIGLVIAKKLVRRAVHRNTLKRLSREVFRHRRADLPICDVVLRLAKSPGSLLEVEVRQAVRTDLESLFVRLCSRNPKLSVERIHHEK